MNKSYIRKKNVNILLFFLGESFHHMIYFSHYVKHYFAIEIKWQWCIELCQQTHILPELLSSSRAFIYLFVISLTEFHFLFFLIKSTCIIEGDNNIVKDEERSGREREKGVKIQFVCWSMQLSNIDRRRQQRGETWKNKKKCNQPNIETYTH